MKFNFQGLAYLAFAALIGFTSCTKDDEETPAPTITVNTNSLGADQTGGTAASGAIVTVNLTAEASEGIAKLTATKTVGGSETTLSGYPVTSGFNSSTKHTWNATYTVVETSGTVALKFSVEDKKGKISSKTFTITVSPINSYTVVLLNNQASTEQKSFYNVNDNVVYNSLADAKANSGKVDFIHVIRNNANGGRKIVAPNSADATDIYGDAGANPAAVSTWSTRNATKFKNLVLTQAQFDGISSETNISSTVGDAASLIDESLGSLNQGTAFGFVLANGKRGVAIVSAVTGPTEFTSGGSNAGSITISVKVQK